MNKRYAFRYKVSEYLGCRALSVRPKRFTMTETDISLPDVEVIEDFHGTVVVFWRAPTDLEPWTVRGLSRSKIFCWWPHAVSVYHELEVRTACYGREEVDAWKCKWWSSGTHGVTTGQRVPDRMRSYHGIENEHRGKVDIDRICWKKTVVPSNTTMWLKTPTLQYPSRLLNMPRKPQVYPC